MIFYSFYTDISFDSKYEITIENNTISVYISILLLYIIMMHNFWTFPFLKKMIKIFFIPSLNTF